MHIDSLIPPLVGVAAVVLAPGLILRTFRQPQLVGYIVAGIIIGPSGLALLTDVELIEQLGAIGVTLLLFFIGMKCRLCGADRVDGGMVTRAHHPARLRNLSFVVKYCSQNA